jgi:hypothetical protein
VTEDELIGARDGPAVITGNEFKISAADTQLMGADEYFAIAGGGIRDCLYRCGVWLAGDERKSLHALV